MGTWQSGGYGGPAGWPAGLRIAGMGGRLGAWLIDMVVFGLVSAGYLIVAIIAGALAENPEATRQLVENPNAQPTVPLLVVASGPLAAFAAGWVVLAVVYPAVCWVVAGALPGQRLLSLKVADATTGANLSPARALARSATPNGPTAVSFAVLSAGMFVLFATEPATALTGNGDQLSQTLAGSDWGAVLSIAALAVWMWPAAVLLSTGASLDHRGLQDLAGRSTVVRPGKVATLWPSTYPPAPPSWAGAPGNVPPTPPPPTGLAGPPDPGRPSGAPRPQGPGSLWLRSDEEPEPVPGRLAGVLRVAPLGRRLSAYVLDMFLVLGTYSVVSLLIIGPTASGADATVSERASMLVGLLTGAAQLVYFVAAWSIWRGSPGQRVMGLLIVRENGDRLDLMDALVRWAVLQGPLALAVSLPLGWFQFGTLVGLTWMAVLLASVRADPQCRGFHDRIAGSRVILPG